MGLGLQWSNDAVSRWRQHAQLSDVWRADTKTARWMGSIRQNWKTTPSPSKASNRRCFVGEDDCFTGDRNTRHILNIPAIRSHQTTKPRLALFSVHCVVHNIT